MACFFNVITFLVASLLHRKIVMQPLHLYRCLPLPKPAFTNDILGNY
ncbi:hypothetical protein E9S_06615 [Moraxella catarrhalis BC7]|nr:hypothetical protein E9S_06615 [Moraxella catarrhalis BC7]